MIAINELSFVAQAANAYEATEYLRRLKSVIERLLTIRSNDKAIAHGQLYGAKITPDIDFHSWIHRNSDDDRDVRLFFTLIVLNGPFVENLLKERIADCRCHFESLDISFSSLAAVAHLGGISASLTGGGQMSERQICVTMCSGNEVPVENIANAVDVAQIDRIYAPTEKHEAHGWGTPMDLEFDEAQTMLRNGVAVGSNVFGKHGEKYYIFRSDNAGGFHGYPIRSFDVPSQARSILDLRT